MQRSQHPRFRFKRQATALLLALAGSAHAGDVPPQFGRYLPLYPAFHTSTSLGFDARDRSYDASGKEQDTATPNLPGKTRFPEQRLDVSAIWTLPLFEAAGVPFFDSRLHTVRLHGGYSRNDTRGALADFARDTRDDRTTRANSLSTRSNGLTDVTMEFGSWLLGSSNWRERSETPYALLALIGLRLPTGGYNRDAPINPGSNTLAAHGQLGLYARPWPGAHLDAGTGYRSYYKNQDPAFGGLSPTNQGDDLYWDLSLSQRVFSGFHLTAFADGHKGQANSYADARFAPNAPAAPNTVPASDNYPTPGVYRDGGTKLIRAGLSLQGFIAQRWLLGLHYAMPLSGESGEFDLPYSNRQPAGCTVGSTGCNVTAGGSTRVHGLGPARVYASPAVSLTLKLNFGQGDSFTCTGCKQP